MKPPAAEPVLDPARPETELSELRVRDHAVLAESERCHRPIAR
jgi:hypothetical protein